MNNRLLLPCSPSFPNEGKWYYVSIVDNRVEKLQTINLSLGNER